MGLRVAIFEDDKDLADILKITMEHRHFTVGNYYSLKDLSWRQADIVLADYRNRIVLFDTLVAECKMAEIPVIAISGAETGFSPQILKPFTTQELESAILKQMILGKKQ